MDIMKPRNQCAENYKKIQRTTHGPTKTIRNFQKISLHILVIALMNRRARLARRPYRISRIKEEGGNPRKKLTA